MLQWDEQRALVAMWQLSIRIGRYSVFFLLCILIEWLLGAKFSRTFDVPYFTNSAKAPIVSSIGVFVSGLKAQSENALATPYNRATHLCR